MAKKIIVWFRNDLRLHDQEALYKAQQSGDEIYPVYIIDPRNFGKTRFGFPRNGAFRARFLIQSLSNLRTRLQAIGSDLIIRRGKPEQELLKLGKEIKVDVVFLHREVGPEETRIEERVEKVLEQNRIEFVPFWGATLFHLADLPFPVRHLPEVFTDFRKETEALVTVRATFPEPETLPMLNIQDKGDLPTLTEWGLEAPPNDSRTIIEFTGGETAGLNRLDHYIHQEQALAHYKETRNGLLNPNDASRLSPWLANGCLSPRKVFEEVRRFEDEVVENRSTYWLIFELIWRDYFRFWLMKNGIQAFHEEGPNPNRNFKHGAENRKLFEAWAHGNTGVPFVDAHMRELKHTGYMSNRGRQNVASYLVRDLKLNWLMGAEWFESLLIDYDVCSNYGNWAYVAGVGADPRGDRYFNVLTQAQRYDPDGEYVRKWCPELEDIPGDQAHYPFSLSRDEQRTYGITQGVDYPHALALPRNWKKPFRS